jgi:hypothetical protein
LAREAREKAERGESTSSSQADVGRVRESHKLPLAEAEPSGSGQPAAGQPASSPTDEEGPTPFVAAVEARKAEVLSSEARPKAESEWPDFVISTLRGHEVADACRLYRVGPDFAPREAKPAEQVNTNLAGEIALHVSSLRFGLRLPLNSFYSDLFHEYDILPSQLLPNSYRLITGFLHICRVQEIFPSVALFHKIFQLVQFGASTGWYYFRARMPAFAEKVGGRPSSVHNWKSKFFFIKADPSWSFNHAWRGPSRRAFSPPLDDPGAELTIDYMKFGYFKGKADVQYPSEEMLAGIDAFLRDIAG